MELVVSDGSLGLPKVLKGLLPQAQQQRCMTHQVRGLESYLSYDQLPNTDEVGESIKPEVTHLQRHICTTKHLERLFREFRTKSDEIGAFPHETSCLTVFFLVMEPSFLHKP